MKTRSPHQRITNSIRSIPKVLLAASLLTAVSCPFLWAAELVVDYDLSKPGSWTGEFLYDAQSIAPSQRVLGPGIQEEYQQMLTFLEAHQVDTGSLSIEDFGPPEFVAEGGPAGRPYLNFQKLGALVGEPGQELGIGIDQLNTDGQALGYTLEMLVRIQPDHRTTLSLGIGGGGEAALENTLLSVKDGQGATATTIGVGEAHRSRENLGDFTVVTKIPISDFADGTWRHLVKVHDAVDRSMTYYIDGEPVVQEDLSSLPEQGSYPPSREFAKLVGGKFRRVSGVDFSFYRAYRGAMSPDEVKVLFKASQKAP